MSRTHVDSQRLLFTSDVDSTRGRVTVAVHWTAHPFKANPQSLSDLSEFLEPRIEVSEVWFVFPSDCATSLAALREIDEYRRVTMPPADLTFRFFEVQLNGNWIEDSINSVEGMIGAVEVDDTLRAGVIADGMRQIFRDTDSLVSASAGFHFERPGRGHSEHFIRTSQAVARAQHAYFIALSVLPLAQPKDGMLMIADTAGVIPLLAAIKDLWHRLSKVPMRVQIDSFGGYDGAHKNLSARADMDCVFISSSTSGTLSRSLIEQDRASQENTFTVYYLGEQNMPNDAGSVLCDLTNRDAVVTPSVRDARMTPYLSYRATEDSDCALCESGSHPIELVGDEFFPASSAAQLRMPVFSDRPLDGRRDREWSLARNFDHQDYFEDFYGLEVISAARHSTLLSPSSPRYGVSSHPSRAFDQSDDSATDHIRRKVASKLEALIPSGVSIDAVLSLEDDESRRFASLVVTTVLSSQAEETAPHFWSSPQLGEFDSLEEALDVLPAGSSILVCAGVIGSGRALLSLSRRLRRVPDSSNISYIICVAHPESANAKEIFEKSLGVRSGRGRSRFEIVWQLPREPGLPGSEDPWTRERNTLATVEGWLLRYQFTGARRAVLARIEQLASISDDQLFVSPVMDGVASAGMSAVNPKFALWPFEWSVHSRTRDLGVKPTQPEIMATVSHLLYESRRAAGSRKGLDPVVRRHGFPLNPAVFDRFNEPQLQSAVLRSAEPGELHYQASLEASRAAADLIRYVVTHATSEMVAEGVPEAGGAAYEFLLSLAQGIRDPRGPGMRLTEPDLRALLGALSSTGSGYKEYPPLVRALLLFIEGRNHLN